MGILDKAMKMATVAKGQIDDVREVHALARHRPATASTTATANTTTNTTASAIEPAAAGAELGDHERDVLRRALERGAPDPFALLTLEEASAIAGVPLDGPHLVYGDDSIGVRFSATGPRDRRPSVEVQAFHAVEDAWFDAHDHWHGFLAEHVAGNGGRPVPDLGDAALSRDGEAYVLAGPLVLTTSTTPADPTAAIALARAVLRRLG